MQHIEALREPNERAEILEVTHTPTLLGVGAVGWSTDRIEADVPAADDDVARRISCMESEFPGCTGNRLLDQPTIETHDLGVPVDVRTRGF